MSIFGILNNFLREQGLIGEGMGRRRTLEGVSGFVLKLIGAAFSLFFLYTTFFGLISQETHVGFYFLGTFIKIASENPFLWTGMKDASAEGRKKTNQMLKQVQHDMTVRFWSFCHPEPGPELDSGSIDFSISFLG